MPDVVLGKKPKSLLVNLYASEDFTESVKRSVNGVVTDWEPGSVVTLHVGDKAWVADLDGATASWEIDKAEVASVVGTRASLTVTTGTVDDLLAFGTVSLNRG